MNLICNRRVEMIDLNARVLICHLRVYQDGERTVVIYSEVPDNPGSSVTNAAELIASQVLSLFRLKPEQVTWIEHYSEHAYPGRDAPESFDLVRFTPLSQRCWAGIAYGERRGTGQ